MISSRGSRVVCAGFVALAVVLCLSVAQARDVVVAAYNVQNYLTTDRRVDGRYVKLAPKPESEIAALITVLEGIRPDILGLIEMGDESMLADFQNRLKKAGLDYPHREWVKGADEHRHVALLSRFPITSRQSLDDVPFDLDGVKRRVGRGILDVSIDLAPGFNLRLVGVHFKSRRTVPEFDQAAMRAKEARALRAHVDGILAADANAKLMIFGDINDTKNEFAVREIMGARNSPTQMRDLYLKDTHGLTWTHFWGTADIYSRIDFLFVSPALWPAIDMSRSGICSSPEWFRASDHRAIYATVKIPEE